MKKITLFITLMITSLGFGQVPTVTFETNGISFVKGTGANVATIGTGTGTNTTQVANLAKGGAQYDAFEIVLTNEVSFAVNGAKTINFDFYQATAVARPILVKFEGGSIDTESLTGYEVEVNTTAVAGWQTLSFNFASARASFPKSGNNINLLGSYKRMYIFIDFGLSPPSNTAIDNVRGGTQGVALLPPVTSFNLNFETPTSNTILNCFDQAEYTDGVTNDVTTGINSSSKAGQIAKINATLYANMQYKIPEGVNMSSGDKGFSIMVKGPRAIPVKFKLEGGTPIEKDANYTTPGAWQKLVFDFTGDSSTNHNLIVLFLDITGAPSAIPANDVFMVDNIVLGTVASLSTNTFEKSTVKMYPNPVQNALNIEANSEIQRVSVYNVLGQEVMSSSPKSNATTLQTSELQKGVYMVTTEIDGSISTSKIIKE